MIFSLVNEQFTKETEETEEISSVSLVICLGGGGSNSFSLVSLVSSVKFVCPKPIEFNVNLDFVMIIKHQELKTPRRPGRK
jgi:hypothetical protein